MKNELNKVHEFHQSFAVYCNDSPSEVPEEVYHLRHALMEEENKEYLQACNNHDMKEIADALGDMLYILCGTIISHGMQDKIEAVFNEIHRSNMSKLGEDGKPVLRKDGKILKGPGYFKPDIDKIIKP